MYVFKRIIIILFAFGFISLLGCSDDDPPAPVDTTDPVISNLSHADLEKVYGSRTITFSADATDASSLTVTMTHNGNPVTVTPSGDTYSASITLEDRDNNTIVVTADDGNNTATETVHLNYPYLTFTDGQAASVVIGQADFDSFDPNQGGSVGVNTLNNPYDVKVINNRLYIADRDNNRVLGFNTIPTSNDASADFVIGQDSFTTNAAGVANNQLTQPRAIESGNSQLFISHNFQTRINVWSAIPTANDTASHVIGQTGFVAGNVFNCLDNEFGGIVDGISYVNGKIIATDAFGNRVLIWNTVPTTSGVAADVVIGQPNLTSCSANQGNASPSSSSLSHPKGLWSDGSRLIVADGQNNRVLIWNTIPTTDNQAADLVLGQADFTTNTTPTGDDATSFTPNGVYSNGNQIFVSNSDRIMIWNSWPTASNTAADSVLGALDLLGDTSTLQNDAIMSYAKNISSNGNLLFVSDLGNNRVLIFQAQ